jgi:hypothetical protein
MATIEINKRTKASMAFLEYCRTLSFVKVRNDDENPSPSGDPWWNIPENRKEVECRLKALHEGKTKLITLTQEERKKMFCL